MINDSKQKWTKILRTEVVITVSFYEFHAVIWQVLRKKKHPIFVNNEIVFIFLLGSKENYLLSVKKTCGIALMTKYAVNCKKLKLMWNSTVIDVDPVLSLHSATLQFFA